jgi:hypothetical protein
MPEDPRDWRTSQPRDELDDPSNPPNALLTPETRNRALMSYLAPVVVLLVIVGVALIYWANRGPDAATDGTANAVGTVGRDAPGGFDPAPELDETADEVRFRGGGPLARGDVSIGANGSATLMDIDAVSRTAAGQRVRLQDIEVETVERSTIWLRDGATRLAVLAPEGATPNAGDRVDVTGTTEADDRGGVRIRAIQVNQR